MAYKKLKTAEFFWSVSSEAKARRLVWRSKFGEDFNCPRCGSGQFYEYRCREIRKCRVCETHVRLRVGTLFEHSKLPILKWLRAIYLVTQDKRGVSALHLKRQLGIGSYRTAWRMLHKIRRALKQRDSAYKLKQFIELDGAYFNNEASGKGPSTTLVAVETKAWVDEKGRPKAKAGFAKVEVTGSESLIFSQRFLDQNVVPKSAVNTDGGSAFKGLRRFDVDFQPAFGDGSVIDRWLPWVHRFISNAKTWLKGTHHGIKAKYLPNYLAEFTYRFNRRHDLDGLFHRALTACSLASPVRCGALGG